MITIAKTTPQPGTVLSPAITAVYERLPPAEDNGSALDTWEDEGGRIAPSAMHSSRD